MRKSMVVIKRPGGKNSKLLDPIETAQNKKQQMVKTSTKAFNNAATRRISADE